MHPDLAAFQPQIATLVSFMEGRLDGPELEEALASEQMRSLLSVFEQPRYPALTNHYRRLHNKQDRTTLGGLVNSEGIIEDFLQKAEVPFQPVKRFGSLYRLILKAFPSYLDPPMAFTMEKIVPQDSDLTDAQRTKIIKQRLKEHFQFVTKPPRWIQNPDWPIRDGEPLIFVGQLAIDAGELFHDKGMAYLFFDRGNGAFEVVAQFY